MSYSRGKKYINSLDNYKTAISFLRNMARGLASDGPGQSKVKGLLAVFYQLNVSLHSYVDKFQKALKKKNKKGKGFKYKCYWTLKYTVRTQGEKF